MIRFQHLINTFTKNALNLLFPNKCPICDNLSYKAICKECESKIKFINEPICLFCGRPLPSNLKSKESCRECKNKNFKFSSARSIFYYSGVIEKSIKSFKYRKNKKLAKYYIELIKEKNYNLKLKDFIKGIDCVVCVPMHPLKKWERSYNQSEVFAILVSREFNLPFYNILYKKSNKQSQTFLSLKDRINNIKGEFFLKKHNLIKHKNILLIDDVFTTGATVNECSKVLKNAGVNEVKVLTLARSIFE